MSMTSAAKSPTESAPIVLLHGFWHGTWCWSPVLAELASRKRIATPVDMAGHGLNARRPRSALARPFDAEAFATEVSPVAEVTLDVAGDLLVAQLKQIGGGQPCVLVAHSMGGAVATSAIQRAPELVAHVVYLTAFMPGSGVPAVAYAQSDDNEGELVLPSLCADPAAVGALRLDPGSNDATYREVLRQAFYNDISPEQADAVIALLGCDAAAGIAVGTTDLTADRWGSVPRTYVACTLDNAIRPMLQRRFIAEADAAYPANPTTVIELEASHSPFLSMPTRVADIIGSR
jgi:pimeloyl-ACP methyl ester carboxylesterase